MLVLMLMLTLTLTPHTAVVMLQLVTDVAAHGANQM